LNEKLISFENHNQRLFGMVHIPESNNQVPAVLMLHGFTGNRIENHFLFVKMARRLAAAGYYAMRFDFRGSGESEGAFKDMTVPAEIDDAKVALAWLRNQPEVDPERVVILGISMGGAVASAVAGDDAAVAGLILWSAVADLEELHAMTNAEIAQIPPPLGIQPDGTFDTGGHLVGADFVKTINEVKPLESVLKFDAPVFILHGTKDPTVPPSHADNYLEAIGKERAVRYWIEGADHTYSAHLWEEEAFQLTLSWLQKHVPANTD
jgi:alpha-beta hydrolase superfamily lysophospholipase